MQKVKFLHEKIIVRVLDYFIVSSYINNLLISNYLSKVNKSKWFDIFFLIFIQIFFYNKKIKVAEKTINPIPVTIGTLNYIDSSKSQL